MLRRLSVRDLALVAGATVEFGPGLCILTGETGAGKSLLVAALAALRGGRTNADLVRHGAEAAVIEAVFDESALRSVAPLLGELGLIPEGAPDPVAIGDELVLRRQVGRDGRSRALVNDQVVTLATLRRLGEQLIDLHGQHEHQLLLDESRHASLLDAAAGLDPELTALRAARARLREAHEALARATAARDEREQHAAEQRELVAEVARVAPAPDEIAELRAERERLRHADKIVESLRQAGRLLSDEDGAALERIGVSEGLFRHLEVLDPALAPMHEQIREARILIEDIVRTAEDRLAEFERDPAERLAAIEDRLVRLESLARRHGSLEAALVAARAAERELAGTDDADLEILARDLAEAAAALGTAADRLSAARAVAAKRLGTAVGQELAALGFPHGAFRATVEARQRPQSRVPPERILAAAADMLGVIGEDGQETVRFELAPNPGEGFHALSRTAAGGELARVMLALRTALRGEGGAPVLVFDEVDTGVGGIVLDAVADRLALLAESRQVLCVTHQARIAARAHVHLRVDKAVREGRTASQVVPLDHGGRLLEIERLLAGRAPGPRAEALAAELLDRYAPRAPEPPRPAAGGARKRKPRLRAGSRSAPEA